MKNRKIGYAQEGRSGYVLYTDDEGLFSWYFEFGGGDCVAILNIPSPENWEGETDRPIAQRADIIEYIAKQVTEDQVPGGHFVIKDQFIEFYSGHK